DGPVAVLVANPIRHLTLCYALFRIGVPAISLEHGQSGIKDMKFAAVLGDGDAGLFTDPGNRLVTVADGWFATDPPARDLPAGFTGAAQVCRASLTSGATGVPKCVSHTVEDVGRRIDPFIALNW